MIWSLLLYCFWDFHLCRIGHYYICDTLIKSAFQKYFEGKKSTLILWFWKALSKCKSFINFQVTTTKIKWCLLYIALAFLDLNSLSWCAPHWMSNVAYSVQKKKNTHFKVIFKIEASFKQCCTVPVHAVGSWYASWLSVNASICKCSL